MTLILMRVVLALFASASGYFITMQLLGNKLAIVGLFSGLIIAILAILFEQRVKKTPVGIVMGGAFGLITGLIVANLFVYPIIMKYVSGAYLILAIYVFTNCVIGYLGLSIGMKKGDEFENWASTFGGRKDGIKKKSIKVIDTSVIIDGRIADICDVGFIEGTLVIPQFVLMELQYIADSKDSLKRAKGKRGLDILHKIQKQEMVEVEISDIDFPKIKDVDAKLVALAKELDGKILTNDVNLDKVAKLQGVSVQNINQLANSLKPIVMPGEVLNILVLKEGKEYAQGVGYLEDGTMVVIDNARKFLGKNVDVAITSILQTASGRMIFSKLKNEVKSEFAYANVN